MSSTRSFIDPPGDETRTDYNVLDRMTEITDALGGMVQFGYGVSESLTPDTDQSSDLIQCSYDTMNRLQARQNALPKTVSLAYEPPGALNQLTDRKTLVLGYTWSRLAAGTVANPIPCADTITYRCDTANRLTPALDVLVGTNADFAFGVRCVASSLDD